MSSARTIPVVVVGSINADLTVRVDRHPRPGETLPGNGGEMSPGGKGANQALAAALTGARVSMVGAVGEDQAAVVALSLLEQSGVELGSVARRPGPTGLAVITVDSAGENSIVVVPGANASMDRVAVEKHADLISSASVVVLQGEIPRSGIEAAIRMAGGRVVLNPAPVLALDPELLCRADPLVVNEHEALAVAQQLGSGPGSIPAGTSPPGTGHHRELISALSRAGIRSVVLTLGGTGCLVADAEGIMAIPAAPVDAVDTTGAGDAFIGALAARLTQGSGLREAARHASRVAAHSVTGHGAQPSYPGPEDPLPPLPPLPRR